MRQDLPVDTVFEFSSAAGVVIKEFLTFPVHFIAFVIISLSRLQNALGWILMGSGLPSSEKLGPQLCPRMDKQSLFTIADPKLSVSQPLSLSLFFNRLFICLFSCARSYLQHKVSLHFVATCKLLFATGGI